MEPAFQMSTSPLIENAVALGSYGVDLERYYLNMSTIGSKLFKNSKFFFLKDLVQRMLKLINSWTLLTPYWLVLHFH